MGVKAKLEAIPDVPAVLANVDLPPLLSVLMSFAAFAAIRIPAIICFLRDLDDLLTGMHEGKASSPRLVFWQILDLRNCFSSLE